VQQCYINAEVTPEEAGTALGGGLWYYGDTISVTVYRNEDWAFLNWTENDEVVSEELTYTFIATGNRNLVAHFQYTEGVGEQDGKVLALYPNPVSDKLIVETDEALGTVEVYNLMGALVYSQKNCANKLEINTSDWPSGIYFLRLTSNKTSETRRFVKE